jgi:hypothetical protein
MASAFRIGCVWAATLSALLVLGCSHRTRSSYDQTITNAVGSEPRVQAFQRLFPSSDHFISYFTGEKGQPRWNSKAALHGRYVLAMQFDITIDRSAAQVAAISPARFYLVEIDSINPLADGRVEISYKSASQRKFGEREWRKLEASRGDLSVLGIEVKRGDPVPHFDVHWRDS